MALHPAATEPLEFVPTVEVHKPRGPRRAAVAFIFVTIALDMFAMGMIAPVLPRLITHFMGGNEPSRPEYSASSGPSGR